MKILGLSNPNSGCGYHRVVNPLAYMTGTRYITNFPLEDQLREGWDIIIYNRISGLDADWNKVRELSGAKIICDMDDDWVLPPGHINYDEYRHLQPRIENNLRVADLVTCTHHRLADRIRPFNENIVVLPNAIPFGHDQFTDEKVPSDTVRLFWAGGISHDKDMELLRNPMKRIRSLPVHTVIGGYNASNQISKDKWDKMVSAFTCSLKIPGQVMESLPVDKYMNHLCFADIMLVPLENSRWHGMKSNLKLLEAAAKKIPVIVSKVQPYLEHQPPVLFVDKQSDWFDYVSDLVRNPELISFWGSWLHDWAQQFDLIKVNEKRHQCFQHLLQH